VIIHSATAKLDHQSFFFSSPKNSDFSFPAFFQPIRGTAPPPSNNNDGGGSSSSKSSFPTASTVNAADPP
jgi:hypothetical protein